jgi:hypothetical protein
MIHLKARVLGGMQGMFYKKKGEHLLNRKIWKLSASSLKIRRSLAVKNISNCPKHSAFSLKIRRALTVINISWRPLLSGIKLIS